MHLFLHILQWLMFGVAVWFAVGLVAGLVIGRAIRIRDRRTELPADARIRVRGRHLHITTRID